MIDPTYARRPLGGRDWPSWIRPDGTLYDLTVQTWDGAARVFDPAALLRNGMPASIVDAASRSDPPGFVLLATTKAGPTNPPPPTAERVAEVARESVRTALAAGGRKVSLYRQKGPQQRWVLTVTVPRSLRKGDHWRRTVWCLVTAHEAASLAGLPLP